MQSTPSRWILLVSSARLSRFDHPCLIAGDVQKGFSRKENSRPNISGGSPNMNSDEEMQPNQAQRNRDGTISKPRAKRGSDALMMQNNKTPGLDKDK